MNQSKSTEEQANNQTHNIISNEDIHETLENLKSFDEKKLILDSNFIDELQNEIKFLPENIQEESINSVTTEQLSLINEFISSKDVQGLMNYINSNCDHETTSFIFNNCYKESHDLYLNLCKEGISSKNAVAYHKYAISLIFDSNSPRYEKAIQHLKESIRLGFNFSYFLLSRLYYEVYKDKKEAFNVAEEGYKKDEKYSKCLCGYFISHGIGTKKDLIKGVSIILNSKAEHLYENFATEIGLYNSILNKKEEEIFRWFEKAYVLRKTRATINNYAVCFMKGIGVNKNIEKAKEIFQIGADLNDSNSMYHLAFLLTNTDEKQSLYYYKLSAEKGDPRSQFIYAKLIEEKDQNLSLQFLKKAADGKSIEAKEFFVLKYIKENDTENIYKYIYSLIEDGCYRVPLNYATLLYKSKNFKQAFYVFSLLSKFNHPIANYFIGVMKYKGEGCIEDKKEALKILECLSNKGIDRASEFLEDLFD